MPTTNKGPDVVDLNPELHARLTQLTTAVQAAGGKPVITSGYRTTEQQAALYNSGNGGRPVAKPGSSLHEKGLAADVSGDPHTMELLHSLAPKFGLSFPVANDPVHVQLAGQAGVDTNFAPGGGVGAPTAPAQNMSLPQRFGVLAGMLNPEGMKPDTNVDTSNAITGAAPTANMPVPNDSPVDAGSAGGIDEFMNAIAKQESGGDYNATNKDSGAHGKYQIMPSNWPSWAKEAGLPPNAAMTPENQDRVARFKMQQYYNQFGNWGDVAKAWYGGPGAVKKNGNASQGAYPTINNYSNQVMSKMGG